MNDTSNIAAHNLLGRNLKSGWKVIHKIESGGTTGGFFSVCYKVERDDEICFLKAFDFAKFQMLSEHEMPGRSVVDIIGDMVKAYQYERDLSKHCKDKYVTKVSFVREAGEETVSGFTYSLVPYLIFDLADGDVRSQLALSDKLDFTWKLKSLHDISIGLKQLHQIEVSHQDLKPSNVLLFNKQSRLGDLGRSLCNNLDGPYKDYPFSGDLNYAPPEIMYRYYESDWHKRVFATDCYLLGSMVVFYFTNVSMSSLLMDNIADNFRIEKWNSSFEELKPYLIEAFTKSLLDFESSIQNEYFRKELKIIVEQLCYPIPEKRGHPKAIAIRGSNYNLDRFVSKFDYLYKKAEYEISK